MHFCNIKNSTGLTLVAAFVFTGCWNQTLSTDNGDGSGYEGPSSIFLPLKPHAETRSRLQTVFTDVSTLPTVNSLLDGTTTAGNGLLQISYFGGSCQKYSNPPMAGCNSNDSNTQNKQMGLPNSARWSYLQRACFRIANTGSTSDMTTRDDHLRAIITAVDGSLADAPNDVLRKSIRGYLNQFTATSHNCATCHASTTTVPADPWYTAQTVSDWRHSEMVVAGSASTSRLYRCLNGQCTSTPYARMPPAPAAAFSVAQLTEVVQWINGMSTAPIEEVEREELARAWAQFYPGYEPNAAVLSALANVKAQAFEDTQSYSKAWQMVYLTLCISPEWNRL